MAGGIPAPGGSPEASLTAPLQRPSARRAARIKGKLAKEPRGVNGFVAGGGERG